MKAKAKGTPANCEATPENVMIGERIHFGKPPKMTAAAIAKPTSAAKNGRGQRNLDRNPIGRRNVAGAQDHACSAR